MTTAERLHDLKVSRNLIERTMSALRPDDGGGARPPHPMYREWEDAMGLLARMHGGLTDLVRLDAAGKL